jgi:hypothetical protein
MNLFLVKKIIFCLGLLILMAMPVFVQAQEPIFDPEYIISDHFLTDWQTMSLEEIQDFLIQTGGTLGDYSAIDIDGQKKMAAEIIFRSSQEYKINPQILITLLQREKGLITKKNPTIDDYNWATGFSCYDYRSPVGRFRGFAYQVDRAAWRLRYYLEHPWQFQFRVGTKTPTLVNQNDRWVKNKYQANYVVTPKNQVTAGFYNYAPHLYDNWLFWKIWQNWFGQPGQTLAEGSLVRAKNEPGVWLIQDDKKRPFYSSTLFLLSYNFNEVKEVDPQILEEYPVGKPMRFPNFTLVKSSLGDIFMLVEDEKRSITENIFKRIGFHPEEIIIVEENDLDYYQLGTPILSPYPSGALLQNNETKAVYYVKENIKYPIIDKSILMANYPYSYIIRVNPEELDSFDLGAQIRFRSGTLVKSLDSPAVYVISQEKRLPIVSEEVFEVMGYQWDKIIEVKQSILETYPLGEIINLE